MNILSDDYSPYGTFAVRVLILTIFSILIVFLAVMVSDYFWVMSLFVIPIMFFVWGMRKQLRV